MSSLREVCRKNTEALVAGDYILLRAGGSSRVHIVDEHFGHVSWWQLPSADDSNAVVAAAWVLAADGDEELGEIPLVDPAATQVTAGDDLNIAFARI